VHTSRFVRKLVTETGLRVSQYTVRRTQYDRLSQQQLSLWYFSNPLYKILLQLTIPGIAIIDTNITVVELGVPRPYVYVSMVYKNNVSVYDCVNKHPCDDCD